jgi:hypothetical protein
VDTGFIEDWAAKGLKNNAWQFFYYSMKGEHNEKK